MRKVNKHMNATQGSASAVRDYVDNIPSTTRRTSSATA